jgi:hypothetical protein
MQSTRAHILVALCSALCSLFLTSCDGHQPDAFAGNCALADKSVLSLVFVPH